MQFKDYKDGIKLSRLGMGNMRLPVQGEDPNSPIDYEKAKAIIDECIRSGINYFDTAYIYHGGESERFVGKALAEYPRDSYYVADKFNIEANPDYRAQFSEQLADNVATFSEAKPLTEEERALAEQVAVDYRTDVSVPCTACRYCVTDCPAGLEIPRLLAAYNEAKIGGPWRLQQLMGLPEDKRPAACVACGSCTGHCPQTIDVPKYMAEMAGLMKR